MPLLDSFDFPVAYDPTSDELVAGATFTVHAVDDLAFASPLAVVDPVSGAAITPLVSSTIGVLPSFRVSGDPSQVILKSGSFTTLLTSRYGALADAGFDPEEISAAVAAVPAAQAARDAALAAQAAAEAVPTTTDGLIASRINTPGSATRVALDLTYVSVIGVVPTGTPAGDVAAINAAITVAAASGGLVRLQKNAAGSGAFQINAKITLPGSTAIGFEMAPGTSMQATAAMTAMIEKPAGGPANGLYIGRLNLDGDMLAERAVDIEQATLAHFCDWQAKNFTTAIVEFGRQGGLVLEITWDGYSRLIGIDENRAGATAAQMPAYAFKAGAQVTDSHFSNVVFKNVVKGIRDARGANVYTNVHPFGYPVKGVGTTDPAKDFTTEVGFELIGGLIRLNNCHPDTCIIGVWSEGPQNQVFESIHYWPADFARTDSLIPYHVEKGQLDVFGGAIRLPNLKSDGTTPSPLSGYIGSLKKEASGQPATRLTFHGTTIYGNAWTAKRLLDSAPASAIGFQDVVWSGGAVPDDRDFQGGAVALGTGSGINGASGGNRELGWFTNRLKRIVARLDNSAESGSNAGSDFQVVTYDDAGSFRHSILKISRALGMMIVERAVWRLRATQTLASNGAVSFDAAAANHHRVVLQANATSSTITNSSSTGSTAAQTGQEITITVQQDATGGRTFAWPADVSFENGVAPVNTAPNGRITVSFIREADSVWHETGRRGAGSGPGGAAGGNRDWSWFTGSAPRWVFRADSTAESGSNNGSNFQLISYADNGTFLANILQIVRASGLFQHLRGVQFARASQTLTSNGSVTFDPSAATLSKVFLQANATSSSIANGVGSVQPGQYLTICWQQDATGGRTYAWPSDCRFDAAGAPTNTTPNTKTLVTFVQDNSIWTEVSRSVGVAIS